MVHPTVQTSPVENVLTVGQASDLLPTFKLVKTDGATLRRVRCSGAGDAAQVLELDHGQEFPDQERGHRWVFGRLAEGLGPYDVGFKEIRETQEVKQRVNETPDETEKRKCVKKEIWEEDLCVPDWEAHGRSRLEREKGRSERENNREGGERACVFRERDGLRGKSLYRERNGNL